MILTDEEKLEKWSEEEIKIYVVNITFLVLYIILCVLGNGLVILVYKVKMNQNIDDRYFIPWLAILDILACTSRCVFELARKFNPVNFRGTLLCKLCWIPINIFAFSSMILLLMIAVQRYLKVCRPFGKQMTNKWKRFALAFTITVSTCPSMVLNRYNEEIPIYSNKYNVTGYVCDINIDTVDDAFSVFIVFAALVVISLMLCLIALNCLIWRQIRKQVQFRMKVQSNRLSRIEEDNVELKSVSENNTNQTQDIPTTSKNFEAKEHGFRCQSNILRLNNNVKPKIENCNGSSAVKSNLYKATSHNFSYMFMLITLAFVLSYIPQFVILFISVSTQNFWEYANRTEVAFIAFLRELNVVNNLVNPFIYGFYDKKFKETTVELFENCKKRILQRRPTVAPIERY